MIRRCFGELNPSRWRFGCSPKRGLPGNGPIEVRLCRLMCGGGYAPPTAAQLLPGLCPGIAT